MRDHAGATGVTDSKVSKTRAREVRDGIELP